MNRPVPRPWLAPAGVVAALFAAYTLRFGYGYGSGDHDELVPSALALLSGERLFARDWLVQTVLDGVNVRTAFVWLLAVMGRAMPLPAAAAVLHVSAWAATAAGVYALGWTLARSRLAAAFGAALALVIAVAFPIGSNAVVASLVTPEGVAWALLVPALALWLAGRPAWAGAFVGVAAWFHLLAAALVGLWLAGATLAHGRAAGGRLRGLARLAVPAGALALPVLVPVALAQLGGAADPAGPSPLAVHAVFRNPWHHLFFSFPLGTQLKFWTLVAAGLAAARALHRSGRLRHGADVARLWALAALGGLTAVLFVEVWPVEAVAKLQLFKLAVPSALLASLTVGAWLAARVPRAWRDRSRGLVDRHRRWASGAVVAVVAAAMLPGAFGRGPYARRYQPVVQPSTPMGRVEAWARTKTPVGTLFLVPPSASTFRSHARRAVVITWNGFVFGDREMQLWHRRLMSVAPVAPPRGSDPRVALDRSYAARSASEWRRLRAAYDVDLAVVPDTLRLPFPVVFRTDGWQVVRLVPAAPYRMERNVGETLGGAAASTSGDAGAAGASALPSPQ